MLDLGDPVGVMRGFRLGHQGRAFGVGRQNRIQQRGFRRRHFLRHAADPGALGQGDRTALQRQLAPDQAEEQEQHEQHEGAGRHRGEGQHGGVPLGGLGGHAYRVVAQIGGPPGRGRAGRLTVGGEVALGQGGQLLRQLAIQETQCIGPARAQHAPVVKARCALQCIGIRSHVADYHEAL